MDIENAVELKNIEMHFNMSKEKLQSLKEYLLKFKEILPAKKLMRVQMAEDRFQRELLRGMQQGRGKKPEEKQ